MKTLQPLPEGKLREAFGAMAHPRDFRPFVPAQMAPPALNTPRRQRTEEVMAQPMIRDIHALWGDLQAAPFVGVTTDGTARPAPRAATPNGAPVAAMVEAAQALLAGLDGATQAALCRPMISADWRRWHNMPLQWTRDGISLEDFSDAGRAGFMALVQATLGDSGFAHVQELMAINRFSGELIGRVAYLNEWCYQPAIFGTPSLTDPWGWQLYGHHLALNVVVIGDHMTVSPVFLAAEPTVVDAGPARGADAFIENEEAGIALIRGLSPPLRARAITLESILNEDVPPGRRHWADSLHLGGAFQDNRVIPLEGIAAAEMTQADRARLLACAETFFKVLPAGVRAARMAEIAAHLDDTWLVWMGGYDDWSPFYFRLQSPVLLAEFDHHAAVFLTNGQPARFHVHTLTRIPNGGDYAFDILRNRA